MNPITAPSGECTLGRLPATEPHLLSDSDLLGEYHRAMQLPHVPVDVSIRSIALNRLHLFLNSRTSRLSISLSISVDNSIVGMLPLAITSAITIPGTFF